MQTNILRVICACALLLSFSLQAIEIPQEERDRITQEVITELGRYDAAEIEKRARLWLVEQPLPEATGELIDGGNCVSGCRLPESEEPLYLSHAMWISRVRSIKANTAPICASNGNAQKTYPMTAPSS